MSWLPHLENVMKDYRKMERHIKEIEMSYHDKLTLDRIFDCVKSEVQGARNKFPENEKMLAAFNEEAGEVTREFLQNHYGKGSNAQIFKECIQTMAMCVRLIQEGDPDFNYRPEYNSYKKFTGT